MNSIRKQEAGFSYIDVMIAIAILLVGVMALVTAITSGITMTTTSQQALTAKQYASSTVEAIYTARDLGPLGWEAVGNVGDADIPGGVFVADKQDIHATAGADGIVGTADDAAGPDGDEGTADDGEPVTGFQREIQVEDIPDPDRPGSPITLRRIDVTIHYWIGSVPHREILTSYIANYRTEDD
jgi:type II secretory pathway pseudopilin PulG